MPATPACLRCAAARRPPATIARAAAHRARAPTPQVRRKLFSRASAYTPSLNASAAGSTWARASSGATAAARRGVRRHHLSDRGRRCRVDRASPSASAARPATSGTGSASAARSGSTADCVADQSERERRHLPHFGIGVRLQHGARAARRPQAVPRGRPRSPLDGGRVPRCRSSSRIKSGGGGGAGRTARLSCATGGGAIGTAASRSIR